MRTLFPLIAAALFIAVSCGGGAGGDTEQVETGPAGPDTIEIAVMDTMGVLMGDSLLEFGKITDASWTRDGRIYVLDGLKSRLSVFSGTGEFLMAAGRQGSGPGEYQYPRSFALMDDGSLVVCDWGGIAVTFLTPALEFDTLITGYRHIAPDRIVPCPDGSYVGMTLEHSVVGGEPAGETLLARFGRSTEPDLVYCSFPMRFSRDMDGDLNVHTVGMKWDTGPDGEVFVAQMNDSVWSFTGYTMEGDTVVTVSRDWERVPKSAEELEEGIVHETLSTGEESGTSVNRDRMMDQQPRYRNAIDAVEVDDLGRIWIGQGWTDTPTFEVYDGSGGLLFVARIPELEGVRSLSFCFDNGFLAWDDEPVDYPKLYLLDSPGLQ